MHGNQARNCGFRLMFDPNTDDDGVFSNEVLSEISALSCIHVKFEMLKQKLIIIILYPYDDRKCNE